MSIPKIVKAMDNIDNDLISNAVEYKRTKKKNSWVKWGLWRLACALLL